MRSLRRGVDRRGRNCPITSSSVARHCLTRRSAAKTGNPQQRREADAAALQAKLAAKAAKAAEGGGDGKK
jgi:hypothetical protein